MSHKSIILIAVILLFTINALASPPDIINYQGRLTDSSGDPVPNGSYSIEFLIYNSSVGGSPLWNATISVNTVNGLFSVPLGALPYTPFPEGLFTNNVLYLTMSVNGDPELTPRSRLYSAPYAIGAWEYDAATVTLRDSLNQVLLGPEELWGGERLALRGTGSGIFGGTSFTIGTKYQKSSTYIYMLGDPDNDNNYEVEARLGYDANYYKWKHHIKGNYGILIDTAGRVALGYEEFSNSFPARINMHNRTYFYSFTDSITTMITARSANFRQKALACYVDENYDPALIDHYAIYARSVIDSTGSDYGIGGQFEGGYIGVNSYGYRIGLYAWGRDLASSGSTTYGVYGIATSGNSTTGGTHYGVYGTASGGSTNYAGYFTGDVSVSGTLSKGGGSFKIDHPLDPENKYLQHSFVESPDMMNIYNGNVITDKRGNATVTMPDYFEALNRDFRYQLTVIGEFAQAIISEEINDRQFSIKTDKPNVKVSWMVTGIRQDVWANKNRIKVEVNKPVDEVGTYIHSKEYNMPAERDASYKNSTETSERKAAEQAQ